MLLSVQQKYILEILRRTGCIFFLSFGKSSGQWAWKFPSTAWR